MNRAELLIDLKLPDKRTQAHFFEIIGIRRTDRASIDERGVAVLGQYPRTARHGVLISLSVIAEEVDVKCVEALRVLELRPVPATVHHFEA